MGNIFWRSCCHPHAKLNRLDKLVNFLLGVSLKLEKLKPNDMASLERSRRAVEKANDSYEKVLEGSWEVTEQTFERLCGGGEPVKVLFHRPTDCDRKDLPLLLWVHGGGMILGSFRDVWGLRFMKLTEVDLVAAVALEGRYGKFCWASLQYRFAPEFKFPAAVDDFVSAYRSLIDERFASSMGYSTKNISVASCSAGSLVACHGLLRLERWLPTALMYPMVDPHMSGESHQLFGTLPACPSSFLRVSWDWLLSDANGQIREDLQRDANLLMSDFSGLKGNRVLVVTATCDCLRDEGRELAKKLEEAGVQVTALEGPGSHCVAHMLDDDFRDETFNTFISLMLPPRKDEMGET